MEHLSPEKLRWVERVSKGLGDAFRLLPPLALSAVVHRCRVVNNASPCEVVGWHAHVCGCTRIAQRATGLCCVACAEAYAAAE